MSKAAIDLSVHVMYTKQCKEGILRCIERHYPAAEVGTVFRAVKRQYAAYLKNFRTDLGGRKNFHNGLCGTYDCIAILSYYTVCREKTSFGEIEELYRELFTASFKRISFVDVNKGFWKRIMYLVLLSSARKCAIWNDYIMVMKPFSKNEPIRYSFTKCPVAEFCRENGLLDILPALCNADYAAMEAIHGRLVRTSTLGSGNVCDYAICGDKDAFLESHREYVDEKGYRRNE